MIDGMKGKVKETVEQTVNPNVKCYARRKYKALQEPSRGSLQWYGMVMERYSRQRCRGVVCVTCTLRELPFV